MGQIERIKAIDYRYWQGQTISVEEVQFLFDCLEESDVTIIARAAVCLTYMDHDVIRELGRRFPGYDELTQHVLIPLFCGTDIHECYRQLFVILKEEDDGAKVDLTLTSLSKTEHPLIQYVIQAFSEYHPVLTDRVKKMLKMAGWGPYKYALSMFPHIPFEREFRDVFGGDVVDEIKKTS